MKTFSRKTCIGILAALLLFAGLAPLAQPGDTALASNQKLPNVTWPSIDLVQVTSGLADPTFIASPRDGSGRLFIGEQGGRIIMLPPNPLPPTVFLDITDRVVFPGGSSEQGLLGMAFPPGYASKGYFYVYYTRKDQNNQVSRFHLTSANVADPASEEPILVIPHQLHTNHNGGQLAFGPDGYLYIGTGDGGGAGDQDKNAQNPATLLGKLLRIGVEPRGPSIKGANAIYLPLIATNNKAAPPAYYIPADNPFAGRPGYRGEIWALGLRNPWRFSFDQHTGDLYIGDVGQNLYEEIDFQPAASKGGENYGWNIVEGYECYPTPGDCDKSGLTPPVFVYAHPTVVNACAVIGGYVYRGKTPAMDGIYFLGDFCAGIIWGLQRSGPSWLDKNLLSTGLSITSFGQDEAGELYLASREGGVYRIVAK